MHAAMTDDRYRWPSRNRNRRRGSDRAGRRFAAGRQHPHRRHRRLSAAAGARGAARLRQLAHRHGLGVGRPAGRLFPVLSLGHSRPAPASTASVSVLLDRRRRRESVRHARPVPPRHAGVRADVAVLPVHAVARALRRELPADRGLHVVGRPHRVVEVAAHRFVFSIVMFVTFDIAFDVIMPKGPLEAPFGY